ncbi:MAG: threonine--tRNA ligase [Candidatus Delongbacteria bacterium]|nr:threonine--tRNA ligase [Candidatus Delongbacteria bacterium]MBN2834609.1 threonine--tRNA ligase [Candidatus Delongbacteria bacterium]
MIKIEFPDGNKREYEKGIKAIDVASSISKSLAKNVIAIKVNDSMVDPLYEINEDSKIFFYKFEDKEGREVYWHSSAHIMASAVKRLFPNVKVTIGPSIEEGFYYDFDSEPFTEDDLRKIEKEMAKIVKSGEKFERKNVSKDEALKFFGDQNESYKVEIINDLPDDVQISCYSHGEFTDLCRGPHLANTSKVKEIKLLATSGAYWRGDVTKKMLQRIYGITFPEKEMMDLFLKRREEAAKRDHRKLGKDLKLFTFMQESPGCPFYLPNGMTVRNELINYWRMEHKKDGYMEIQTPIMLNQGLWETSGHWANYRENMFISETEGMTYAIKPMNCPGGILVYNSELHSYRDLPLKVAELGHVHRNEFSGALSGLFRVRSFVQDDAHIYMREDQIKDEILGVLRLVDRIYSTFGIEYDLELSTRPEKSIGTDEAWEIATEGLREALVEYGKGFKINEGDGAFYGPKIDIHLRDAIGRTHQCGTIQLDMNLPARFDMYYIDENSQKKRPVMIHRAIYGSIERFLGLTLEHFGGFLPLWMSPVQVMVIPVSDKFNDAAKRIYNELDENGIRVEIDLRNEKVGYKIREADGIRKTPYMLVIGEKEESGGNLSVRQHKKGDIGEFSKEDFFKMLKEEIKSRKLPDGYKLEL